MRKFARAFYLSKAWRRTRAYIHQRDSGLCVKCGAIGEIVHHRTHLTPRNIHDSEITLNENNLELLCRECHHAAHPISLPVAPDLAFDEFGNLVQRKK